MGASKVHGHCPDCDAGPWQYLYNGISKHCFNCGRDNHMEECVKVIASIKRNDPEGKSPGYGLKDFKPDWLKATEDYRLSRVKFKENNKNRGK